MMLLCRRFDILILAIFLHYGNVKHTTALFKLTKVDCRTLEPSLVNITKCTLKPVRRDVTALSVTIQLSKPLNDFKLRLELFRKYNTYQPFLYSGTFDVCSYLKNHNNYYFMDIFFALVRPYTNVNHSCPYENTLLVDGLMLQQQALSLPWPSGDYMMNSEWYLYNKLCARIYTWATLRELEQWQKLPTNSSQQK